MYTIVNENDLSNFGNKIKDIKKIEFIINFFFFLCLFLYFFWGIYILKNYTDVFNWDCYILNF